MNMGNAFLYELKTIRHQPWLQAMLLWLPLMMFACMWLVFSSGTAHNLPIGVVDNDHSQISRGLIRYYDASPTLAVTQQYTSVQQGSEALKNVDIYALVVIPKDAYKQTLLGESPTVTAFYNSQFILTGKLINAAMQQAQGTYNAGVEVMASLSKGSTTPTQALAKAVPIRSQITPLFNSNSHYGQFLVSAAIPAIWQIIMVATTILTIAVEQKKHGLATWLGQCPAHKLLTKLLPYTAIYWLQGMAFLWGLYVWLGWPMHGSWGILMAAQLLMVIACQSVGALFYMVTQDATRSMSFVAAFTAPAFAFMGITFPASDMPALAQFWRALLPVSHYIELQVKQVNNGVGLMQASDQFLALLSYLLVLLLALLCAKRIARKQLQVNDKTIKEANV
ncbi:ABC transporter permease [Vibrio sp. S11_S32]|uniref:ABC transporter permease n=1 Tax=Vibrio sp. S11_S32 TaxID=2720225 RepID=UPI00167FE488|nr:ABC transporter permease [Vibrio sp. S11_S32]MBD1575829.1 ABC transporter permease [Vibrio sp. S11_S32]